MTQRRLVNLLRDLEQHGVQFLLVDDQIEVTGLALDPWLNDWLERNAYRMRRLLRGELPGLPETDQDADS